MPTSRREQQKNELIKAIEALSTQIELGGADKDLIRQLTREAISLGNNEILTEYDFLAAAVRGERKGIVIKSG